VVRPDGVAPSRIVCVTAYVNLPLHHKVQKFSSGTGSPGWSRKKGRKTVVVVVWYVQFASCLCLSTTEKLSNSSDVILELSSSYEYAFRMVKSIG